MVSISSAMRLIAGYSAALISAKLLALAINFLLAYKLSNADFGYISLAQAIFLGAIGVFGFNAQSAYTRYTYEHGAGAVLRALAPSYGVMLFITPLTSFAILGYFGQDSPFAWFALLPVAGLAASHLASSSAVARSNNDLRAYAVGEIGRPAMVLLALLVFFIGPQIVDIGPFFVGALLFSSLVSAAAGWILQRRAASEMKLAIPTRRVVLYVAPLFVMQLVALANGVSDRFFLATWFTIEDVGLYSKAYLAGSVLGMAFDSISILWAPYVVRQRPVYRDRLHPWVRRLYVSSWLVATCLLVLAWGLPKIGGPVIAYLGADLVTLGLVIAAAFVIRTGYQVCVPVLNAFDMTPLVAKLATLSALTGLVANVCLIYFLGALGAALATMLAFSVFSFGAYKNVFGLLVLQKTASHEE